MWHILSIFYQNPHIRDIYICSIYIYIYVKYIYIYILHIYIYCIYSIYILHIIYGDDIVQAMTRAAQQLLRFFYLLLDWGLIQRAAIDVALRKMKCTKIECQMKC